MGGLVGGCSRRRLALLACTCACSSCKPHTTGPPVAAADDHTNAPRSPQAPGSQAMLVVQGTTPALASAEQPQPQPQPTQQQAAGRVGPGRDLAVAPDPKGASPGQVRVHVESLDAESEDHHPRPSSGAAADDASCGQPAAPLGRHEAGQEPAGGGAQSWRGWFGRRTAELPTPRPRMEGPRPMWHQALEPADGGQAASAQGSMLAAARPATLSSVGGSQQYGEAPASGALYARGSRASMGGAAAGQASPVVSAPEAAASCHVWSAWTDASGNPRRLCSFAGVDGSPLSLATNPLYESGPGSIVGSAAGMLCARPASAAGAGGAEARQLRQQASFRAFDGIAEGQHAQEHNQATHVQPPQQQQHGQQAAPSSSHHSVPDTLESACVCGIITLQGRPALPVDDCPQSV
jgi:hypothetical protein